MAAVIAWTSIRRPRDPVSRETPGVGLAVSTVASPGNLGLGLALLQAGWAHRSIALGDDGGFLLTGMVTSTGVLKASCS